MPTIEERVQRLERENRRLKLMGLVAIAVVASVALMGQARPAKTIEAEGFFVKDEYGIPIASLSSTSSPNAPYRSGALTFYNRDGSIGTWFWNDVEGPTLQLNAGAGRAMIRLTTTREGEAAIHVSGDKGDWSTP